MAAKILILGASGRVGSKVVAEFGASGIGVDLRVATSKPATAEKWREEGHDAVVMDLDNPSTFPSALASVDRVFLLTGYTSDMLRQSKMLIDAAVEAGVSHIVHLGVFSSGRDLIPHFNWHDLIETYIKASGIAWTNLHPNVIADSVLVTDPPITETGSFQTFDCTTPQGWVFAIDIAAVAAAVLREGPEKHGGRDYWLSTEVLNGADVAERLTASIGKEIKCVPMDPAAMESYVAQIPSVPVRAYMESAVITLKLCVSGKMQAQTVVRDDVQTVLGRPGITIVDWAAEHFH